MTLSDIEIDSALMREGERQHRGMVSERERYEDKKGVGVGQNLEVRVHEEIHFHKILSRSNKKEHGC